MTRWLTLDDLRQISAGDLGIEQLGLEDGRMELTAWFPPSAYQWYMTNECARVCLRRRRIVRVATLKYRARKRRR